MGIDVSDTDLGLKVPVATENPLVTVGETAADVITLVAAVADLAGQIVTAEEKSGNRKVDVGCVVLASHGMNTDEVTVEARAGPPAVLGHEQPVLCLSHTVRIAVEAPCVESVDQIDCGAGADTDLQPEVRGRGRVVEQICLYRYLGMCAEAYGQDSQQ